MALCSFYPKHEYKYPRIYEYLDTIGVFLYRFILLVIKEVDLHAGIGY